MTKTKRVFLLLLFVCVLPFSVKAHCEIPCGIYDDFTRLKLMLEHAGTIERAMHQIQTLESADKINHNQLVRWVMNKEDHAEKLQAIATQYFMFQRVKLNEEGGLDKKNADCLAKLHQITVYAMKCKQSSDPTQVKQLRESINAFAKLYFTAEQLHELNHTH